MEKSSPEPVKFFISILKQPTVNTVEVIERITAVTGDTDWVSPPFPFDMTDFYEPEMGEKLTRHLVSIRDLLSPADLVKVKEETLLLEDEWKLEGRRRVNLDPGYIDFNKVVLASLKPGGWKIYLDRGIWADMNLYYSKGGFLRFGWTFPDFRSGKYDRVLLKIRSIYKDQVKGLTR